MGGVMAHANAMTGDIVLVPAPEIGEKEDGTGAGLETDVTVTVTATATATGTGKRKTEKEASVGTGSMIEEVGRLLQDCT